MIELLVLQKKISLAIDQFSSDVGNFSTGLTLQGDVNVELSPVVCYLFVGHTKCSLID